MPDRVVIVEDDRELRELLVEMVRHAGHDVTSYANGDEARQALAAGLPADLVVTDLRMPGLSGEELLRTLRRERPELHVIIITAFGSIESAIELVKAGAYDYVTKPFATDELLLAVDRALTDSRLRRQVAELSRTPGSGLPGGFIGASAPVRSLHQVVLRAGQSRHPVLITGESGAGKELVARAVHEVSGRARFVALNCGALPEQLLESELFGYERGAFSGADRAKPGLLETAHRGTAFLDEIGELPLTLQPKLLRVLEEGEVRRLGATATRTLDLRIVAATNRDLEEAVAAGRFRDDLYWRLAVIHIEVPALRERSSDIPILAEYFLTAARDTPDGPTRIEPAAMALLAAYPWPGNVRELRNAIQRAAVLAPGSTVRPEDLPPRIRQNAGAVDATRAAVRQHLPLHEVERAYILEVLRDTEGNKSRAAEILGLDRKTLYRKLEEYRASDARAES